MGSRVVVMAAVLALPVLLAGCDKPGTDIDPASQVLLSPAREESLLDNLTARLHPQSGPFFPDLWIEDNVSFPGGGNISLNVGLGVRCEGNATSLAPNGTRGWVTCSLRLASDPTALVESSRRLELGFDYQPLTQRTPAEPVEWRVLVEVEAVNATTNATESRTAFDSGWRPVDLSPRVTAPSVLVDVVDACDAPDETEVSPYLPHKGLVMLNVSFTVLSHAQATVTIDVGASVLAAAPEGWPPPADVEISPHVLRAVYPSWGSEQPMLLRLPVDLETDAAPGSANPGEGPCTGSIAHEEQVWSVTLDFVGADGRGGSYMVELPMDVYVALPE